MVQYLSKFLYVLVGSKRDLMLLMLVVTLTSVLEAFGIGLIGPFLSITSNPQSIRENPLLYRIYTELGIQSDVQFIALLGLVIVGVFCIKSVLYFLSKVYIYSFSFAQKGKISLRLLTSYLAAPYTFHLRRNTADLIKNILLETQKFCDGCLLPILQTVSNFVVVIVLILLLANTSLLFFTLILGILLPIVLIFHRLKNRLSKWGSDGSIAQKEIIRVINHSLGGLKDTRIIGCETYFKNQMEQQINIFEKSATLFYSLNELPRILIETLLVIVLVSFVCIYQVFFNQETQQITSVLGVFAVASIRLIPAASQMIGSMNKLQNTKFILDMLYLDLKEVEQQEQEKPFSIQPNSRQVMNFGNRIELDNVTYRYPGSSEAAINDISLVIKKGQSIALIGKSGAGKTTLVDVILGFLKPESGDIRVDGISTYANVRSWQNLIGYIPQSIFLIDDTIERNIAFGVTDDLIDSERLDKALRAAQIIDFVEKLPEGIKTVVGERGVRLSGGQRQRIGIARALYHEREILVLDEATSALDNETENLVTEAVRSLFGKTMIIIAHRLTTVEHCDYIYLLENGRLVKSGSYQEVVLG